MLCALGVASLRAQAPVDQSKPTFRSAVDLVSIQASVRDKRGRPVGGLTTADFEVRDNGHLKPILSLRSDRRSPVSLAVLVDMSGSMRISSKMAMARRAFDTLLSQLRDGQDELALFTFDAKLHERQLFTTDLGRFKGALDDFHPFGTTSLYDATAATRVASPIALPPRRRSSFSQTALIRAARWRRRRSPDWRARSTCPSTSWRRFLRSTRCR